MLPLTLRGRRRIVVLGVGNELNGDDAAGVLVARALKRKMARIARGTSPVNAAVQAGSAPDVLVIEAGLAPENFSGLLRRFHPQEVIFVDAADLAQPPGAWAWVDWQDAGGFGGSTHLLPLSVFAEYLIHEFACQVAFIAIQPLQLDFGSGVSRPVQKAIREITRDLASAMVV